VEKEFFIFIVIILKNYPLELRYLIVSF
jgi:hypothetical protein